MLNRCYLFVAQEDTAKEPRQTWDTSQQTYTAIEREIETYLVGRIIARASKITEILYEVARTNARPAEQLVEGGREINVLALFQTCRGPSSKSHSS